jgi:hypothetical protein
LRLEDQEQTPLHGSRRRKTLMDVTARDNPKVRDIKVEKVLDYSIVRE